jgi:OmpA-OmpF porin, OOP family
MAFAFNVQAQKKSKQKGAVVKDSILQADTTVQLKIENLGLKINSNLPELRPTISADGQLLFFICENHPANNKFGSTGDSQDIWVSQKDSSGQWGEAMHLEYPINTTYYNAVFWISPDNNRILLRGSFTDGGYAGKGVSMSYLRKDGSWSTPNMLQISNYEKYDRGHQSGACMSHDGKTLLFYFSEIPNSYDNDIYVSFLQEGGYWSEPKSIGKKINLPKYNEMTPFLAADGQTLYFSSNRPGGLGDNDIWMTKRLDKTWEKWADPVNLGAPINSKEFDGFFTTDAGGEYAYLATGNNGYGESDIVRVKLIEKDRPAPVILVTGNVYNAKTKQPLSANLVYETLPNGENAGNGISSPVDGAFNIVLPYGNNYSIRATANKFFSVSENLPLDSLIQEGYKEIHKDLYLVPVEIGQVVRLNNVFFDFDKYDLRPESFVELNRVVKLLNENPNIEIEMSAHTDNKGSDDYNFILSDNRAKSVKDYIVSQGISASRIVSRGYGETKPEVANDTDENRQINRRVEFTIIKN